MDSKGTGRWYWKSKAEASYGSTFDSTFAKTEILSTKSFSKAIRGASAQKTEDSMDKDVPAARSTFFSEVATKSHSLCSVF